ncbi:N-acetylglucosaminyl-phosphatidylinositol de-N-acetylase [Thozetella sp. PMI_491]|nr:N-acetylglucosaminyl-phosphatidylinositol de-N-acetylase [Thozetella sp. PMI_491]
MDILIALSAIAVVLPVLYTYTVSVVGSRFPTLKNKRICLLIAHPDDEAMFFAPTMLALTRPETGNHVKILCLSSGDADGLGETRKKELVKSGITLGLRNEDDVFVVESPDFPDSMTTTWDTAKIASLLGSAFAPHLANAGARASAAPSASIDVLVTFDVDGVSGHPNHKSLYHGAKAFIANLVEGKAGSVDLYTLSSVSVLRKYTGILDVVATLASWALHIDMKDKAHPGGLVFLNSLVGSGSSMTTARKAMVEAHQSQMVWFRWGWITLSRYMLMNDLKLVKAGAA